MPTIPPPPGELVDVGGYGLHLQRQGRGSPPVVLEAALGDCSLSWALVQPKVASCTTVHSYDRAGLAWSDTGRTHELPAPWSPCTTRCGRPPWSCPSFWPHSGRHAHRGRLPGHVKYVFATEFDKGPVRHHHVAA
jgi:hypothetical protein